ncbi:MAG TPA: mechanosensitive ion channel, partial [Bacteroidales bacterium]|nr:mechanosensitive ion channel [Bacteroidales bacterium]
MYDYLKELSVSLEKLILSHHLSPTVAHSLNLMANIVAIALMAMLANFVAKKIIISIIKKWVDKSTNDYDDVFYEKGVFNRLSHLAPALVISKLTPIALYGYNVAINTIATLTNIYILLAVIAVIMAVINALHDIYNMTPMGKQRSIKGYIQAAKSIVIFIGVLMVISILVKKDLSSLFAGLTAFAAVLMFVFKDAILGLVAGIQISSNDILRVGDYIEMPSRGADGTVIDIKLSTVKVHNANRTIVTIPTYSFVNESFLNWRGLDISLGRRIKRSINIDMQSIFFCNDQQLEEFKKNPLVERAIEKSSPGIYDKITNAQVFRLYIEEWLKNNKDINAGMPFLVRYL